jgi:hypothetical protein
MYIACHAKSVCNRYCLYIHIQNIHTLHYIIVHYITLDYITLEYTTPHYTTLHYTILQTYQYDIAKHIHMICKNLYTHIILYITYMHRVAHRAGDAKEKPGNPKHSQRMAGHGPWYKGLACVN